MSRPSARRASPAVPVWGNPGKRQTLIMPEDRRSALNTRDTGITAVKLYVGNLSFDTSESDVREALSQFGQVDEVTLISDRETGRPKGFGFVVMPNDQEAREAINALDGKDLGGRNIKVNEAKPRTERSGGGRNRW
jgi:cold-inducible RNA-binding protein